MPLYLKTNSIGEFVFDWNWAEAYRQAGGRYYPKIVSAVPFTPVTGRRLLVADHYPGSDEVKRCLLGAADELVRAAGVSGLHVLFPDETDRLELSRHGLLLRLGCQYHWFNEGYRDFDDFLDRLTSRKRKEIRRERQAVRNAGLEFQVLQGRQITPDVWAAFFDFYASTFHRKWGSPRLTLPFFRHLGTALSDATLLFLARQRGQYVAGAFAMRGSDTLYGRHWGCRGWFRYLHFELCYYQTIEYCIREGLKRLDAGAQGEHKLSRGFLPVATWSAHRLVNREFRNAVERYLAREQSYVRQYISELSGHPPYKQHSAQAGHDKRTHGL